MAGRLAPSGQRFLPELSMIAELAVDAARALRERLTSETSPGEHALDLAPHAREADRLAATVITGAARALVPPIDGEDARELASRLRDVVVAAHRLGRLVGSTRPVHAEPEVAYLADLLVQATDSLEGAAATLTDRSGALDFARDVRRLDREGDRACAKALGALLDRAPDPLDAVRRAELYRTLRESLRACARAAALVECVALKRF